MKKTLLSLVAVAALGAAAAPALAQTPTGYVDGLEWRIDNAAQEGRISWPEARQLRAELRSVQPIAWRVQTGEASGWERQRLERAVSHIQAATSGYRGGYGERRSYAYQRGWR